MKVAATAADMKVAATAAGMSVTDEEITEWLASKGILPGSKAFADMMQSEQVRSIVFIHKQNRC